MTQEELAKKLGYKSKSTINKVELGVNDIVQSKVVKYAEVLGVTPSYLMGWEENLNKENSDLIPDILSDNDLLEHIKKLMCLNDEHRQAIYDNATYWYEKEGH